MGSEGYQARRRHLARTLFPLALLFSLAIFPTIARADTVTLTGGQVLIDSTLRVINVDLSGGGLSIHSVVDLPAPGASGNNYVSSTIGCGCDGIGLVTYNGITVSGFVGGGTFTESMISGSITLLGNFDGSFGQPPFPITVDYTGMGFLERTPMRTTFIVSSAVPEPGTLLLLGSGFAGLVAAVRRRRKAR
jgi:PEP-CTERM motif